MERRTNEPMDERKSENYIPPHTLYVGGIIIFYWELRKIYLAVNVTDIKKSFNFVII